MFNEIMQVQSQQEKVYRDEKGKFNVNGSLGESLGHWATQNQGKNSEICRNLKKELKLDEQVYFQLMTYHFAANAQWDNINEFLKMKKPPCSVVAIGDICNHFRNREMALTCFNEKVSDVDEKITLLIDYAFWGEAIQQVFRNNKQDEYLDQIIRQGDSSVQILIKQEQQRMQVK